MGRLGLLTRGISIRGNLPGGPVTAVDVAKFGDSAVELTDKDTGGRPGNQLVSHIDQRSFEVVASERPWSFDDAPCRARHRAREERDLAAPGVISVFLGVITKIETLA